MDFIITMFTVLSMYMNLSQDNGGDYCYNADIDNGIVRTMYVYEKSATGLIPTYSYQYDYDEAGRLSTKTAYRWNAESNCYQTSYQLCMAYLVDTYELSRSVWDNRADNWQTDTQKMVYQLDGSQNLSVNILQRDTQGRYHAVDHFLIQDAHGDQLLAIRPTLP